MEYPKYVLSLDDLPVVVESDDRVWPVYLTHRDASRLFGMDEARFYEASLAMPFIKFGGKSFIEVAKLVEWIKQNERQPRRVGD